MRRPILSLLVLSIFSNVTLNRHKRVLKSQECSISDHPYVVSITGINWTRIEKSFIYTYFLSYTGILITPEYCLTYRPYFDEINDNFLIKGGVTHEFASDAENGSISFYTNQWRFETEPGKFVDGEPDNLALVQFHPPFKPSPNIQPVKLPHSKTYIDTCHKVSIIGWGIINANRSANEYRRTTTGLGDSLRCSEAKLVLCDFDDIEDSTRFCFEMLGGKKICRNDVGHAVMCQGILVGLTQKHINFEECSLEGLATNISHFTKWFHDRAGVEVSFEGTPDRKWQPQKNKEPVAATSGSSERRKGATFLISIMLFGFWT